MVLLLPLRSTTYASEARGNEERRGGTEAFLGYNNAAIYKLSCSYVCVCVWVLHTAINHSSPKWVGIHHRCTRLRCPSLRHHQRIQPRACELQG